MILHIDTGKTWRGGQQQAFYLHESLVSQKIPSLMICKKKSMMSVRCRENSLPFLNLPLSFEFDLRTVFLLVKYIKKYQAQILHLHDAHSLSIGLLAKLFYPRIRLIAVRRVDFTLHKSFLSFYKYHNNLLDCLVCISEKIGEIVLQDGIPKNKTRIIPSGINIKKYQFQNYQETLLCRQMLNDVYLIPKENILVGTISAVVGHKDYPSLLKAAQIVLHKYTNITFIACGEGKQLQDMQVLHSQLQLGPNFIFTGFQDNIIPFLKAFDIFVLSSKLEGLGTSVLNAMAAAKAIVACKSGGIPEMIRHEKNGLLAEKENPDDLAKKIMQLIASPELREELAKQAAVDVENFSIENTVQQNIKLYQELGYEQ